jgi:hypothetical protein
MEHQMPKLLDRVRDVGLRLRECVELRVKDVGFDRCGL